jgi:AcrR family transcriptional regulator
MGAVEAVIRERGLERATVRAIAARAGVAVGTVYRRFKNKRALILAVQRRFLERRSAYVTSGLRPRGEQTRSIEEALAQFVNGAVLIVERDRPLLRAFAADASSDREILAALSALSEHVIGRPLRTTIALDVLLSALRALVLDGSLPSGIPWVREHLTDYLSGVVRRDRPVPRPPDRRPQRPAA